MFCFSILNSHTNWVLYFRCRVVIVTPSFVFSVLNHYLHWCLTSVILLLHFSPASSLRPGHPQPDDACSSKCPDNGPSTPWGSQWHVWVFITVPTGSRFCLRAILSQVLVTLWWHLTFSVIVSDPSSQPDGIAPAQSVPPAPSHSWTNQKKQHTHQSSFNQNTRYVTLT